MTVDVARARPAGSGGRARREQDSGAQKLNQDDGRKLVRSVDCCWLHAHGIANVAEKDLRRTPLDSPSRSSLRPFLQRRACPALVVEHLSPWSGAAFNAMFEKAAQVRRYPQPRHCWHSKAKDFVIVRRQRPGVSVPNFRGSEKESDEMRRLASPFRGQQLRSAEADRFLMDARQDGLMNHFVRGLRDVGLA